MRKAIIEKVAKLMYPIFYPDLEAKELAFCESDAENLLTEIGFFELLEAAEVFTEEKTNNIPHALKNLETAIAKAKAP